MSATHRPEHRNAHSAPRDPHGSDDQRLDIPIRRERERRQRSLRYGRISVGHYLATAGAIGWLIVTPALLATFAGRWLDNRLGTGITMSGAFMVLGLILGCYLAWNALPRGDNGSTTPDAPETPNKGDRK